jgi:hypothetical protein
VVAQTLEVIVAMQVILLLVKMKKKPAAEVIPEDISEDVSTREIQCQSTCIPQCAFNHVSRALGAGQGKITAAEKYIADVLGGNKLDFVDLFQNRPEVFTADT